VATDTADKLEAIGLAVFDSDVNIGADGVNFSI
jgi:hypothetical protein